MRKWIVQTIQNDCKSITADNMEICSGDSSRNIPATVKFGNYIIFNMDQVTYIMEDKNLSKSF